MSYTRDALPNREGQVKFAQSRVSSVEKFYGLLCGTLGSLIRKSARLRDKGDLFATQLKDYADHEHLNSTTKVSLLHFAENFSVVQDYRNTEVQRLELKVLKPLMKYGDLCKNMKSNIRSNASAWDREKKNQKSLEKVQQKQPSTSPQVAKAQSDLEKARKETGVYGEQLVSEIDLFERNKLSDMKSILKEFVQIEMMFHAKALQYLSKCYEGAQHISTESDMDEFRSALLEACGLARSFTQTSSSYTSGMTTTNGSGLSFPSSKHQPIPKARTRPSMYDEADDEDSDDEDDDDYYYES